LLGQAEPFFWVGGWFGDATRQLRATLVGRANGLPYKNLVGGHQKINFQQGEQMNYHFGRPSKFLTPPPPPNLVASCLGCQLLEAQFTQPARVEVHIWVSKI